MRPWISVPYKIGGGNLDTYLATSRTNLFARSYGTSVSVPSAVAMQVGPSTVEVDASHDAPLRVYVDKRPVHLSHIVLRGGGRLVASQADGESIVYVIWPDGTNVAVQESTGRFGVPDPLVSVGLAPDREGHVEGLLGNWGTSAAREFVGRNGRAYAHDSVTGRGSGARYIAPNDKVLYREFGASWRITQRESRFHYGPGKSTRSYTIPGFPHTPLQLSDLSPKRRAFGESVCQPEKITNQSLLDACVLDVGETDDPGFATFDRRAQNATGAGASLHPIRLGPGNAKPEVAYDPSSHDTYIAGVDDSGLSIDVCTVTAASPSCNGASGPDRLTGSLAISLGANPSFANPAIVVQPGGRVVVLGEINPSANSVRLDVAAALSPGARRPAAARLPPAEKGSRTAAWSPRPRTTATRHPVARVIFKSRAVLADHNRCGCAALCSRCCRWRCCRWAGHITSCSAWPTRRVTRSGWQSRLR
jgi:hypothetical protein